VGDQGTWSSPYSQTQKGNNQMSKECCASDIVDTTLNKVGITRSLLITLALLPFAWDGVNWAGGAVRELWNLIASV
jgi:hypothetical protein